MSDLGRLHDPPLGALGDQGTHGAKSFYHWVYPSCQDMPRLVISGFIPRKRGRVPSCGCHPGFMDVGREILMEVAVSLGNPWAKRNTTWGKTQVFPTQHCHHIQHYFNSVSISSWIYCVNALDCFLHPLACCFRAALALSKDHRKHHRCIGRSRKHHPSTLW